MSMIIHPDGEGPDGIIDSTWTPDTSGVSFGTFKREKINSGFDEGTLEKIERDCVKILGHCLSGQTGNSKTAKAGLVVGNIQSGKTSSFTGVTALARDNGFDLIVILCGTKRTLSDQNQKRIQKDLCLDAFGSRFEAVVDAEKRSVSELRDLLNKRDTPLLMLFKGSVAVRKLAKNIKKAGKTFSKALIIDDEADAITPNTAVAKKGEESATYADIKSLRESIGIHTYLGYTATPQAHLVIDQFDSISPEFAVVLNPGPGYIGYEELFLADESMPANWTRFVELEDECLRRSAPDAAGGKRPDSLTPALYRFFLTVAIGLRDANPNPNPKHRSMMIHPHGEKKTHDRFAKWVRGTRRDMLHLIDGNNPKQLEELQGQLSNSWDELREHSKGRGIDIGEFSSVEDHLREAIDSTRISVFNSEKKNQRIWDDKNEWAEKNYSHILIGGQNLDRGFTVEGLTITYMPRPPGQKQVDTISQRARFCGYKESYAHLITIYMSGEANKTYKAIVPHEKAVRDHLRNNEGDIRKIQTKMFDLAADLNLTRPSIITAKISRIIGTKEWSWTLDSKHPVRTEHNQHNQTCVLKFRERFGNQIVLVDKRNQLVGNSKCDWILNEPAPPAATHEIAFGLTSKEVYKYLIKDLLVADIRWDSARQLIALGSRMDLNACVVFMSPSSKTRRGATNELIPTISSDGFENYKGDKKVVPTNMDIVLRLHEFEVRDAKSQQVICENYITPVIGMKQKNLVRMKDRVVISRS